MEVTAEIIEGVLLGSCPLDQLPPQNKKVVRIFVSSTFSGRYM